MKSPAFSNQNATAARLLKFVTAVAVSGALSGCDKPVENMRELDGCYFAGGENPVFEIKNAKLTSATAISSITIMSKLSDSSVISFSPGIRLTENVHKSMIAVQGNEAIGFAFRRGPRYYIVVNGGDIPVQIAIDGMQIELAVKS